jgi:hypothetical protein
MFMGARRAFTHALSSASSSIDPCGCVLRPPVAQERIDPQKEGLVAITLKRAYADGTVVVVMAPRVVAQLLDER